MINIYFFTNIYIFSKSLILKIKNKIFKDKGNFLKSDDKVMNLVMVQLYYILIINN